MWTSFIVLSLAFIQIYGQGFQLFFGTTAGITECKDKLPNCYAFGKDSCKAPYDKWAKDYCPNTCGFCIGPTTPAPPCVDLKQDCEIYQKTVCTDQRYKQWAYDNCRRYCRLCTAEQNAQITTTTLAPAQCVDKLDDCKLYGKGSCGGQYKSWAKENCRRYCGFCVGLPTQAPPCRNKIPNCNQYQKNTCTSSKYRGWAEENCNKYCGFCNDGSGPGTNAPTPVPTPIPAGTLAPPLPGKRNLGAASSAEVGQNVLFEKPKPKATPKPTPMPTTAAPTPPPTTPAPPTTTEAPTTEKPKPKPLENALSVGSSATGNGGENVIDFGNGIEMKTTEEPTTKKPGGTGTGTGSSAGGTSQPPVSVTPSQAPVVTKVTNPPKETPAQTQPTQGPTKPVITQAPAGTTAGTGQTGGTGSGNGTDTGTGSQPGGSKPPSGATTASPGGTTAGSGGNMQTTAGSGGNMQTTAGSGSGSGSTSGTGTGGTNTGTGGSGSTNTSAGTGSGPKGSTPGVTLMPSVNSVTLPDINKADNYTNLNSTDTECRNLINCRVYPPEKICTNGSIYQPWAKVRCRAYCGFCNQNTSPVPCVDKIPNCNEYDADLCTNPLYRLFREDNCLKFCNLCKSPSGRDAEEEETDSIEFY